jgi:transcriptional regulatory protein RtcR
MKRNVVIGLLGPKLDAGKDAERWNDWRPSVALCQHEDLLFHRYELLMQPRFKRLADIIADDIRSVSPETEVNQHEVKLGDPWAFESVYGALHDFARQYVFDVEHENYYIHITTGTHVAQICMFLLTESRDLPGVLIQASPPKGKRGRKSSPAGSYVIVDLDLSKYDRIAQRFQQETDDDISFLKSGIETLNASFNRLIECIEKVALRSEEPFLLQGPTGAGKSRLARRIFELKKTRRQIQGDFVEVNCATLRGDAAMSALFGHKKGAFTGALQDRAGLLKAADGGMLFLDEVGELGLDEQAMLLGAIEEKRFLPMGSDKETESRFQLICGTNRDLQSSVENGRFREDLLARINLWTFRLPGLKDRFEDIEPNLRYELDRYAERTGNRVTFNKEALDSFLSFAGRPEATWSANFRDLNGAVIRMATLAPGGRINAAVVGEELERLKASWNRKDKDPTEEVLLTTLGKERAVTIDLFDRAQLASVIQVCRKSKSLSEAGRALFNVSRSKKKSSNDSDRLRKYLAKFGLSWSDIERSQSFNKAVGGGK